jgi:hypothetical protein
MQCRCYRERIKQLDALRIIRLGSSRAAEGQELIRRFAVAVALMLLAACGGGGGGGGGGGPAAALVFSPGTVSANYVSGTSATVTVRATVNDASLLSSPVYVYVVDSNQVLTSTVNISPIDAHTFAVSLYTSPTLPRGRYQGTFQVQLCRDANCTTQFAGSPVSLPYDLTVTPKPLGAAANSSTQATMYWGAVAPADVTVSVAGDDLNWTASTTAGWLSVSNATGTGSGTFKVSCVPTGLAVGTYGDKVSVRSTDGQVVDVDFSLQVLPAQFSLTSGIPSFSGVNGATIPAKTLSFEINNKVASTWTATSSAAWMIASPLSGTTPDLITLQPDPTIGPLASGSHSSDLVLSSAGIADRTVTSNLSLVKATLSAPSASVTIGGPKGRDLSAKSLRMSLNTGSRSWPWTMSVLPAGLASSTRSGTVSQDGTDVSFSADPATLTPGSVSHTVTLTAPVNGDTVSLPVTVNLNVDQRRLLVSDWGVAFTSTPAASTLTRTLQVSDNFGGDLAWTAVSDNAWLTVTSSGSTGSGPSIALTADPSSLPSGAMSYANVTVASNAPGVNSATIRVALWKDSNSATSVTKLPLNYSAITADRIRPYIYANNGGASVDIYHAYSAQKIGTISSVGAALGQMTVSPDGSKLYVLDTASRSMAVVDLGTATKVGTWTLANAVSQSTAVLAVRPNGVELVLVGDGTAYNEGRSLGNTGISGSLTASADGRKVFVQNTGLSPASVYAFDVDYSAISGGVLMVSKRAEASFINGASNGRDIAVSADGTHLYTASGAPYPCSSVDPSNLSFIGSLPGGDAYPNNMEVTVDGRAICGISGWYSVSDFWVHRPDGTLIQGYKVAGYARALKAGQMAVTPDGFVVVTLTDDPLMAFVPIGP